MKKFGIGEEEKVCANCVHYRQHWAPFPAAGQGFDVVADGYCVYPRNKLRKPDQTCEHFRRQCAVPHIEGRPLVLLDQVQRELLRSLGNLRTVEQWIEAEKYNENGAENNETAE